MGTHWERLAGRSGGTVAAFATTTTADGAPLVYAATAIGLHLSADGGRTWSASSVGSIAPFVETLAVSPNFPVDKTIFVGTRDGLYRSLDAGKTWQLMLVGSRMLSVVLAPHYARENLLFVGTETDGALRSPDAGRTWTSSNPGLLDLTVLAIALSPQFESDLTGFLATASGLYRTRNGGKSWRAVELELEETAVQCLAVSPDFAEDRLVLAGTEADGLLVSRNAGGTWEHAADIGQQGVTAVCFSSPTDGARTIAVATVSGIMISRDAGQSWVLTGQELGPVLSLTFTSSDGGEALLAGLPQRGVARSEDGGETWQMANDGLAASLIVNLALSPDFERDQTLFAAGLEDGVQISSDGGTDWTPTSDGLEEKAVFSLAISPRFASDRTMYAATSTGIFRSSDAGAHWEPARGEAEPATAGVLAIGPAPDGGPAPLLAGYVGGKLRLSEDGGATWHALGQAFGGAEVIAVALSPRFGQDRTIFASTSRPTEPGADSELVLWRSTDSGQRWERWLIDSGQNVMPIAIPPTYPASGVLFVGAGGTVKQPVPKIQEIRGGARRPMWHATPVSPDGAAVTALAVTPTFTDDRTLFAATSDGIYVSRDGGTSFTAWSEDLDPRAVVALAVSPSYASDRLVYAITLGGSIWRRRDA